MLVGKQINKTVLATKKIDIWFPMQKQKDLLILNNLNHKIWVNTNMIVINNQLLFNEIR